MGYSIAEYDINAKLKEIFKVKLDMDLADIQGRFPDCMEGNLLTHPFNLKARGLICLLYAVEEEFGIAVPEEDVLGGRFDTLNHIMETINGQLQQRQKEAG